MIFPCDVSGWLTEVEGSGLAQFATDKCVLEVGSYCGRSTICMAQVAKSVCSVDPHDGRATPNERDTYDEFLANLKHYGVAERVLAIRGTFDEAFIRTLGHFRFQFIFIDGAHGYEAVQHDLELAIRMLTPDGLLAVHDYRAFSGEHDGRWDEGVTRVVNELLTQGAVLIERHGTVAVIKPSEAP